MTLEAHFINDYGLDSLDIVEIVMAFENEFGKSCLLKSTPCLFLISRN